MVAVEETISPTDAVHIPSIFADEYKKKVKEYVKRYATEAALKEAEGNRSSSESSMSEFSEDEAQDMEL